jgi:adenylate cyclase
MKSEERGRVERRLAAILAVDVANYAWLMGEDEEGTLNRLRSIRRELVDPKIGEHRGRIVKRPATAFWSSSAASDAVRCAAEVQRAMALRNADVRRMTVTRRLAAVLSAGLYRDSRL